MNMTQTKLTTKFQDPAPLQSEQTGEEIAKHAMGLLTDKDADPIKTKELFNKLIAEGNAPTQLSLGLMCLKISQGEDEYFETGMNFVRMSALKNYEPAVQYLDLFTQKTPAIKPETVPN